MRVHFPSLIWPYRLLQHFYLSLTRSLPRVGEAAFMMKEVVFPVRAEMAESTLLQKVLRPGDVVVEVGARTGASTLFISSLVGQAGAVIAIEPNPYVAKNLRRRTKTLGNTRSFNVAASDYNGYGELKMASVADTGASLVRSHVWKSVIVPVFRIDTILASLGVRAINGITIDAEGSELAVLGGATSSLESSRFVLVELHHFLVENLESRIFELLESRGFRKTETLTERPAPFLTTVDVYEKPVRIAKSFGLHHE